jgi:hypothetical protein
MDWRQRAPAFQGAAFVLAEAAPDAGVLTAVQRPGEAVGPDGTAPAHCLRILDLPQRRTGVTDRKEQFWVLLAAHRVLAPIHGDSFTWRCGEQATHRSACESLVQPVPVVVRQTVSQLSCLIEVVSRNRGL